MASNLKHRPRDFKDVIGNKQTVEALEAAVANKERSHAYLFTGDAGCGKTTLARILSKKIGCSPEDLYEYNMSNNRGIDTARDIIKHAYVNPLGGSVKVYLLDEVHKTTNEFQNAILKILEEPPWHLYFILCTTEPEKLIKTVRSRCMTFSVSPLSSKKMRKLLESIIEKEKMKKVSDAAIDLIIDKAAGVPRDALISLDKIVGVKNEEDQLKLINALELEKELVINLCRALLQKQKWAKVSKILSKIEEEPESVRRAVLGYFAKVLLSNDDPQAAHIIECFSDNFYDTGRAGLVLACYSCMI